MVPYLIKINRSLNTDKENMCHDDLSQGTQLMALGRKLSKWTCPRRDFADKKPSTSQYTKTAIQSAETGLSDGSSFVYGPNQRENIEVST